MPYEISFFRMFVRDAYYRKNIKEKVTVTDKELLQGAARYKTLLKVNFLFSTDEKEIKNLYKLLKAGVLFDTLLASGPEIDEQPEPVEITFGQMQKNIEDTLYALKPGRFTAPFYTPEGWYIFRLVSRTKNANINEAETDVTGKVEKLIKNRKETDIYREFYKNFFGRQKVDVDAPLFNRLAAKIAEAFSAKPRVKNTGKNTPFMFDANDVLKIEEQFGPDTLAMPYVKFTNKPFTTKDFIRLLVFEGFGSDDADFNTVRKQLAKVTGTLIEQELVTRQAYAEGYANLPQVKHDVEMWKDNYLFQLMQNTFNDTVKITDTDVLNYYKALNKDVKHPMLVNIIEILTDSIEVAAIIQTEIQKGTDFKTLSEKYNKREWTKKKSGEYGLFPVTAYGEIGRIAGLMQVGDVYGPLKTEDGYSIFKLIDKQEPQSDIHVPFEQVKDKLRQELIQQRARTSINTHTVDLAYKYGIDIDPAVFNSVETTTINSLALRFLGFGGKITAVPLAAPNNEWVDQYFRRKNQLP